MTLPLAFMFPGQGAQYPGMAAGLYDVDGPFTETMDRVFANFDHGSLLRETWLAGGERAVGAEGFDDVRIAQPLLFGVDCALAAALLARGPRPSALIGHSVGEIAAAQVAGVIDLETGCSWIRGLIEWCLHVPSGGMLAVAASRETVEPYLRESVVVGAVNGARQVLVAGPDPALEAAASDLRDAGMMCFRARAHQPFHSPAMTDRRPAPAVLDRGQLHSPTVPLWSCYTADVLTDDQARDPGFWQGQPARTVLFGPTLERLLAVTGAVDLIEVGPGSSLSTLARRSAAVVRGGSTVSPCVTGPGPEEDRARIAALVDRLAQVDEVAPMSSPRAPISLTSPTHGGPSDGSRDPHLPLPHRQ